MPVKSSAYIVYNLFRRALAQEFKGKQFRGKAGNKVPRRLVFTRFYAAPFKKGCVVILFCARTNQPPASQALDQLMCAYVHTYIHM